MRKYLVLIWACLLASAAVAGEQHRTRVEIDIDDEAGQSSFNFDSQDAGFDLHDMAVGERRQLVDEAGNVANVLRTDDGFEFDINGRTFDLEDLHGERAIEMHMHSGDAGTDVIVDDVRKVKKVKMIRTDDASEVTIISGAAIDEATRQRIREALQSAGQDGEVVFIDGSEFDNDSDKHAHRRHEVRIIKKEVDATN